EVSGRLGTRRSGAGPGAPRGEKNSVLANGGCHVGETLRDITPRRRQGRRAAMAKNMIDLKGRTAVVTGGAQGFGKAITDRFLKSGAGIAIWDRDAALAQNTAKALGGDVEAIGCDVADPASVAAALDATVRRFGRIDILVNNAGIA